MSALLALDTSTDVCSVACTLSDHLREHTRLLPRAHNRHVLAMLEELLEGRSPSDFDAIVCGVGPGSFTGIRVAVGVAQGLAWSLDLPVIPFCSLMAQALSGLAQREQKQPVNYVLSLTAAQGGLFYSRLFRYDGDCLYPETEAQLGDVMGLIVNQPREILKSLAILGAVSDDLVEQMGVQPVWVSKDARPQATAMLDRVSGDLAAFPAISPELLTPSYVQTEIGWKKLSEQPRRV